MNKRGASTGVLIMLFLGVVVCLTLLIATADQQSLATSKQTTYNETDNLVTLGCVVANADGGHVNATSSNCNVTLSYSASPTDWRASDSQCDLSSVTVTNSSLYTFAEGTDYNLFNQSIQWLNATTTRAGAVNATNATYSFCNAGYNKDSSSRTVAGLPTLFLALALLAFVAYGIREWNS